MQMWESKGQSVSSFEAEDHLKKVHTLTYYHGLRSRDDVEPLLRERGDFLVRMVKARRQDVVLSVCVGVGDMRKVVHVPIKFNDSTKAWELQTLRDVTRRSVRKTTEAPEHSQSVKAPLFQTLHELIKFHKKKHISPGVVLVNGIKRPKWLIPTASLKFDLRRDFVGQGNFCQVVKGRIKGKVERTVAIKMLLDDKEEIQLSDFERDEGRDNMLREAQIMSGLNHRNVITFYGVACDVPPVMIVMEFCPGDSLLNHLVNEKENIVLGERILFALEAARGMRYLHHHQVIHRDLATRNCLISSAGVIKISDFGLSKGALNVTEKVENGPIKNFPLRWTAPEAISKQPKFSAKSDSWSFGVVLYEIFNLGVKPWPDEENNKKVSHNIRTGHMPELPSRMPAGIVTLTKKCWTKDPADRPDFHDIVRTLYEFQYSSPKFMWPTTAECSTNRLPGVTREQAPQATAEEVAGNVNQVTPTLSHGSEDVSRDSKESHESAEDMKAVKVVKRSGGSNRTSR